VVEAPAGAMLFVESGVRRAGNQVDRARLAEDAAAVEVGVVRRILVADERVAVRHIEGLNRADFDRAGDALAGALKIVLGERQEARQFGAAIEADAEREGAGALLLDANGDAERA